MKALGCRLNQYEGLSLEGKLRDAGYDVVPFGEQADLRSDKYMYGYE